MDNIFSICSDITSLIPEMNVYFLFFTSDQSGWIIISFIDLKEPGFGFTLFLSGNIFFFSEIHFDINIRILTFFQLVLKWHNFFILFF